MPTTVAPSARTALPLATMPVACLGRSAATALQAETRWRVRAVFRRSFYCRSEGGVFVCLGPLTLGNGPLNALYQRLESIDWEVAGLTPGAPAVCDGGALRVAERFTFALTGAEIWRPEGPSVPWQPAALVESLAELASEVRAWPARGGLQALVWMLGGRAPASVMALPAATPLIRMAMGGIGPLTAWLERRFADPVADPPVPVPALDVLLGLGPGLTPSGDDFLGGLLVTLRHVGAHKIARSLAWEVLPRAGQRTNEISRAHLAAAAKGEGLAPLHDLLARLGTAGAFRGGACLSAIDAIGHTSGWDALAGVAFAAAVMARVCAARGEIHTSV